MTRGLDVTIRHRVGEFSLDVAFTCGTGLTALVGPSGSGKTTILNVIAGLIRPELGLIRVDGEMLADTRADWPRPEARRLGYVFQEPRLFPHLSVRQNLLFGHRDGQARDGSPLHFDQVVGMLKLEPLLGRRPRNLSGGEQQRVALGRALLAGPRLLLLDEPLAAVDQAHRAEILPYLDALRSASPLPTLYVTHAPAELAGRAEQVVAIRNGRIDGAAAV